MALGKSIPFFRWSVLRMIFGMRNLLKNWQVGDGREEQCARFVTERAPRGDLDAAIAAIDEFAYRHKFLINVGDEKGAILDAAVERARPMRMLELGAYVGYSALRTARKLPPGGKLYSVEFNADNAAITRRILEHAGVGDRVTVLHGYLGDGGKTVAALRDQHGFGKGTLDMVFVDHAKEAYLPDLQLILANEWLHAGSVLVADNVGVPGAPEYKAFMDREEGRLFHTVRHEAHVEYQSLIKDFVLESTKL